EKGMAVRVQDRFHTIAEFAGQLFPGAWDPRPVQPIRQQTGGSQAAHMQPRPRPVPQGGGQARGSQGMQQPRGQQNGFPATQQPSSGAQARPGSSRPETGLPLIRCMQGRMQGKQLLLRPGVEERIGRGNDVSIVYPADCPGISRHQCSFMLDNRKRVYVRDDNSSYGTMLNGQRMRPLQWYPAERGSSIKFATEEYRIV
ncbi:MAG: FHA domain-containing protein, partial [Lachnospiraceae bacterium]|nr:FHA domain-containing protein [Lachnospiraceae bacterium]